ncbi:MAG: ribonuclease E/G, partial [Comamonas sp.]|nr:ribonuclease E/G [Comamonas sp.]
TAAPATSTHGEQRERRSRDRYGRDRHRRNERPQEPTEDNLAQGPDSEPHTDFEPTVVLEESELLPQSPRRSYFGAPAVSAQPAHGAQAEHGGDEGPSTLIDVTVPVDPSHTPLQTASAEDVDTAKMATPMAEAPMAPAVAEPFALPVQTLADMAQASGLVWVQSDTDKVAAVQSAIAAEPRPVHVPRERPVPAEPDAGPLVLVETRRDLRQVQLPFDRQA